jgi:hypothetical protein
LAAKHLKKFKVNIYQLWLDIDKEN